MLVDILNIQVVFLLSSLAAFILGLGKAGFKGIGPIVAVLMAISYGAKNAAGMLVPLLLIGDLIAIFYYRIHIQKKYVVRFLPWVLVGLFTAGIVGDYIPELLFRQVLSVLIVLSVIMMWIRERQKVQAIDAWWFSSFMGIGAGFTSMIGNFSGAFGSLYFLATRIPKRELIGTVTFVFFIGNLCKVPFHLFVWKTLTSEALFFTLHNFIFLVFGFLVGTKLIKHISEQFYRRFLLIATAIGAIFIILK